MKSFWNQRFSDKRYAYGKEPNVYFKEKLDLLSPGKILLAAEGEGRNAVYAAKMGWEVYAYDFSEEAFKKAQALARENKVEIHYTIGSLNDLTFEAEFFDAIGLIYVHFPDSIRSQNHSKLLSFLSPGGHVILEGFSSNHTIYQALHPKVGGPKDLFQLYNNEKLSQDFASLTLFQLEEQKIILEEGYCHVGETTVMRLFAQLK